MSDSLANLNPWRRNSMNDIRNRIADLERQFMAINWKDELDESDMLALRRIQGDLSQLRSEQRKLEAQA
jgi:hypothetical protein